MATRLTRNIKLRITDGLTADAIYNLERLDLLGSTFLVDSTDNLNIRSNTNIVVEPESPDIGGSGTGGTISIGTASHSISALNLFADSVTFSSGFGLLDQATGGNKYLQLAYKSDLNGSTDTSANRTLRVDLDGSDRSLVLGGSLTLTGGGSLVLTAATNSSITVPISGTLATLAGSETLTNKSIDAAQNTISNISNSNISASAGISYSKLALSNSITNSDISASAGISYSKLSLLNSIVNADISSSAAIQYSKILLSNSIVNADISSSAAISGSKIVPSFGSQLIQTDSNLEFSHSGFSTTVRPAQSGQSTNLTFTLPSDDGTSGQLLRTDGSGNLSWVTSSGGGGSGNVSGASDDWLAADGTTKVFTHNLGSTDIDITIIDLDTDEQIGIQSIVVTDVNTVTLSASESPMTAWRMVAQANP